MPDPIRRVAEKKVVWKKEEIEQQLCETKKKLKMSSQVIVYEKLTLNYISNKGITISNKGLTISNKGIRIGSSELVRVIAANWLHCFHF